MVKKSARRTRRTHTPAFKAQVATEGAEVRKLGGLYLLAAKLKARVNVNDLAGKLLSQKTPNCAA